MVYSIDDSTEEAIQKMIEVSQRMINEQNNPIVNKHFKLQIKTLLQKAPRDADKLERLLKVKERQKENATYMEDTERLVAEERLKCSKLYFVFGEQKKKRIRTSKAD